MSKQDERVKSIFNVTVEWSDYSEHSPTRTGQLPIAAILPTDERVDIGTTDIQVAMIQNNVPFYGWVKMGRGISCKEKSWGNDGSSSVGRSGASLEILAPKATIFIFEQGCDYCGDSLREISGNDLTHNRAPETFCEGCQQIIIEQEQLMKEQAQEEQEYYQEITFAELEQRTGIRQRSLVLAAGKDTLDARKSGSTWMSSVAAVDDAISAGYIRRRL